MTSTSSRRIAPDYMARCPAARNLNNHNALAGLTWVAAAPMIERSGYGAVRVVQGELMMVIRRVVAIAVAVALSGSFALAQSAKPDNKKRSKQEQQEIE